MATSNASTSKNYVQVPQFQVMTVSNPASLNVETKPTNKRLSKANKNNAESQAESVEEHQHIQLVTMDQNSLNNDCNNQYIIQMPQNQQFQVGTLRFFFQLFIFRWFQMEIWHQCSLLTFLKVPHLSPYHKQHRIMVNIETFFSIHPYFQLNPHNQLFYKLVMVNRFVISIIFIYCCLALDSICY